MLDCQKMLEAMAITLREGLGAFVIVAVALAFFHRNNRRHLVVASRWGIGLSVLVSVGAGALFSGADDQALWEGWLSVATAACVAWLGIYMWRTAPQGSARPARRVGALAAFVVTILMIVRGGMEIALLLGALFLLVPATDVMFGAWLGVAIAIMTAWLWSHTARRIHRTLFQHVTAIFLALFFVYLLIDGIHELAEANAIARAGTIHAATEAWSADGIYGQYAPHILVAAPLAWFVLAIFLGYGKASDGRVTQVGR